MPPYASELRGQPASHAKSKQRYCLLLGGPALAWAHSGGHRPHPFRRPPTQGDSPMAATAESVRKPDFKAQRKHFLFTDEHEALRESIRNFAIKELAPHAE